MKNFNPFPKSLFVLHALMIISLAASAQFGTSPWTAPSGTYTVPAGVTSLTVTCYGGGGGGGGAYTTNYDDADGGGGGGGACSVTTFSVTPGQSIIVAVGGAGTAGNTSGSDGGAGGTSTVKIGATTYASAAGGAGGGGGGVSIDIGSGGTGGSAGTGTIHTGGNGGAGAYSGSYDWAGGGGGGAGTTANGGNGASTGNPPAGGTAGTTGGGAGGTGKRTTGTGSGAVGATYGGGGGGGVAYSTGYASAAGKAGAAGAVIITYSVVLTPTLSASALTAFGNVCAGSTAGPNSFTITGLALTTANVTIGSSAGYTFSTTAGGTYTSSLSLAQSGGSYSQTIYVKFTPPSAGSYAGAIAIGGGGASTVNVTPSGTGVSPLAQPTGFSGTMATCAGTTGLVYSVTNNTNATSYTWTLPSGWSGTSTTNSITATAGSSGGTITVTPYNVCGAGTAYTSSSISITTTPTISSQSTGTQTQCSGGTFSAMTVTSATATNYQWYKNTIASNSGGTAVTTGTGGTTNTYTPASNAIGTVYYYCIASNGCPTSATSAVSGAITTTSGPYTPGAISGTTTICKGSTSTLTVSIPTASGGSITQYGTYPNSYTLCTFNPTNGGTGTFTVPAGTTDLVADVLVVAGGGGGGSNGGGGGGGGGVTYTSGVAIPAGNTSVTIGAGGNAAASSSVSGSNGSASSLGALVTAAGGGGGGSRDGGTGGQTGGSGGGGGGAGSGAGSCNPGTYSGTRNDGGSYGPGSAGYVTINCMPTGATITSVSMDVSIGPNCSSWYFLGYSYDNSDYYYQPSAPCSGVFTETLWNGGTNGERIYVAPIDNDGWSDNMTISINSGTTVNYTYGLSTNTAGAGTASQGNAGNTGTATDQGCNAAGGGGGGAGGLGYAASNNTAGNGGAGVANSITGSTAYYGGGGGGGTTNFPGCGGVGSPTYTNGKGNNNTANGGGSDGESGVNGTANTGGGGGAETNGGSGIVALRYPGGQWSTSNSLVATVDQSGNVTGVGGGTATITYTVAVGSCTKSSNTTVSVRESATNVALASSSVNNVTLTAQCTESNGWTYYADPSAPDNWLFSVYKNGNTFTPSISLTVNPSATETRNDGLKKASYTLDRYWNVTISGTISPALPVKVRFFYSASDTAAMRAAAVSRASIYGLATTKINGLEWFKTTAGIAFDPANNTYSDVPNKMLPTVAYGTQNGISYVEYQGLTSFSGGTAGMRLSPNGLALPVTLLYLTATPVDNSYLKLDWATASEVNNKGFEIERSTDGATYETIAWIDGNGNSNEQIEYSYSDKTVVPNSIYYYRLKQIDVDGKFEYTNIVSGTIIGKNGFVVESLRPNPANNKVTVQVVSLADQNATVSVTDMLGREVSSQAWQISEGFNGTDIDLTALAIGTYNVIVRSQNQYFTKKLVVSR